MFLLVAIMFDFKHVLFFSLTIMEVRRYFTTEHQVCEVGVRYFRAHSVLLSFVSSVANVHSIVHML